ncbi:MAG TPA: hypothetical protein VM537_18895 [Anaerolineae bacterium]|jgi:hypothetical protein|nr:hypothetical protein [Anaerolineae bacterium]
MPREHPLGFDSIANLPDDGAREKEVFARFGLALYAAQVLEQGFMNLIIVGSFGSDIRTDADFDEVDGVLGTRTAGQLLRRLRAKEMLTEEEERLAAKAVDERNRLAHHFFAQHSGDFMTPEGKQIMLDDADTAGELFRRADALIEAATFRIGAPHGVTEERVSEVARSRLEALQAGQAFGPTAETTSST